jgi:hypothetical protein
LADFWANVEHELKRQGRRRAWLSQQTGISINTLNGWSKKGRHPRITEAVMIARALDTSVESLLGETAVATGDLSSAELDDLCTLLGRLSRDELLEIRGVVRNYCDRYFTERQK